jgi:Flp pilus assembly protein TadD/TolB-like protein
LRRAGFIAVALFLTLPLLSQAQSAAAISRTLIVIPFENASTAPGLEWIGESFPEILGRRLSSPSVYVLGRDDRIRAYDQLGIPVDLHPSRATIYRIAEQLGVDYVVLGQYTFDGRTFTASAQLLDVQKPHLSPAVTASGPLIELIDIQSELAWELLRMLRPDFSVSRDAFRAGAPPIRLGAFENYVRGMIASDASEKIRRFREAVRSTPNYTEALLQLGKTYYGERDYEQAIAALEKIPRGDSLEREAAFFLGLSAYGRGDLARAESAFNFLASQLPLTEVRNNLGVVAARRGEKSAVEYFQKAVQADPNDADYHFNLGLAYYRAGDLAGASHQLRETLNLKPSDQEAKSLLDAIAASAAQKPGELPSGKIGQERMKRNYDESSFRQLALEIQATAEERLVKTDRRTHAQFHSARGHELLAQGFVVEAEAEFREAVSLDGSNPEAHSGLARALETRQDSTGARSEASAALQLRQFAEPLLVLARLDLRDNRMESAAQSVDRALALEPSNGSALALKRAIAAKLAEKAQPLPNP